LPLERFVAIGIPYIVEKKAAAHTCRRRDALRLGLGHTLVLQDLRLALSNLLA